MDITLSQLKQKFEQPPFVSFNAAIEIKSVEQERLDREKEEYFSRGGTVTCYSPTSTIIEPERVPEFSQVPNGRKKARSRNTPDNASLVSYHTKVVPPKGRMNIAVRELKNATTYVVNIAGIYYGAFDTEDVVITFRDEKRKFLNMPDAEY